MTDFVPLPFGELPGEGPTDPTRREVVLSGTPAVVVAALAAFWPAFLPVGVRGVLWSTLLLPIGLLALYRAERGAMVGLAVSIVVLLFGEVLLGALFGGPVRWDLVAIVALATGAAAWVVGMVAGRLHRNRRRAVGAAYEDRDTGLPRRELLQRFLDRQVAAARRGEPLTVVLFGIDGLSELRRTQGDGAAGSVLRAVGDAIELNSREMDFAGRLTSTEVLAVLPDTGVDGARTYAVRTLEKLSSLSAQTADGALMGAGVEVRAGIAAFAEGVEGTEELLERARRALETGNGPRGGRITTFTAG